MKNPSTYLRAQQEVDKVVGKGTIQPKHIKDLRYVQACLRESLRVYPTAPAIFKKVNPDQPGPQLLGGKYLIEKTDTIMMALPKIHTDPKVYGEDAQEFKPERMMDDKLDDIPAGAFKASLRRSHVNHYTNSFAAFWQWYKSMHRQSASVARGNPNHSTDPTEFRR